MSNGAKGSLENCLACNSSPHASSLFIRSDSAKVDFILAPYRVCLREKRFLRRDVKRPAKHYDVTVTLKNGAGRKGLPPSVKERREHVEPAEP
jgi:hypothetical protein